MKHRLLFPILALFFSSVAPHQDGPATSGFPALTADPYVTGLFEEVRVVGGPPTSALAQEVHGTRDGTPFVNVLRWTDARSFRGKLLAVRQRARLETASIDTAARLWVRVLRADGTAAYEDDGLDQSTSWSEWRTLTSIGAVAEDATDLCFGLIVEGTTQVYIDSFELEVLGDAPDADPRFSVPQRWAHDADVRTARLTDSKAGLDLHVTSFVPPGYSVEELPHLWILRTESDLRTAYVTGRALLEAMQMGREPAAVVSLVHAGSGSPINAELIPQLVHGVEPDLASASVHAVATPPSEPVPVAYFMRSENGLAPAAAVEDAAAYRELLEGDGFLHSERVHLRWACAQHDAKGDRQLAALFFEASIASVEPWDGTLTVQQASHSLDGHDCGHDHSPGSGHTHSHD